MYTQAKILIASSDSTVETRSLVRRLNDAQYSVSIIPQWQQTLRELYAQRPHALVLLTDAMTRDRWNHVRNIRDLGDLPVIIVASRVTSADLRNALELGLDGFLTAPLDVEKLMSRLSTALKRVSHDIPCLGFQHENLSIDWRRFEVRVDGMAVCLTPTEFKLLSLLVERQNQVVSNREILSHVWGLNYDASDRHYVKLYIWYLRRKLEQDPAKPRWIISKRGIGYSFCIESPPSQNGHAEPSQNGHAAEPSQNGHEHRSWADARRAVLAIT